MNDKNLAQLSKLTGEPADRTPIEIALGIDADGNTTARKLYEFLELAPNNYSRWCKVNILDNEFAEEGNDFYSSQRKSEGRGNFADDYKLTAKFAKKLSMTAKNERGEEARNYFIGVEDKLKEVAINMDGLSVEMQALIMHDKKIQAVISHIDKTDNRLDKLEFDIPLYGCESKELSDHVKRKGVQVLGGKKFNAYEDKAIRTSVYRDIYDQIKREFGLYDDGGKKITYLALKRKYLADAHECIDCYDAPMYLQEQIDNANAQMRLA